MITAVIAQAVLDAQQGMLVVMPAHAARPVTAGNGIEFTYYYRLADTLGVPMYFADPYSS